MHRPVHRGAGGAHRHDDRIHQERLVLDAGFHHRQSRPRLVATLRRQHAHQRCARLAHPGETPVPQREVQQFLRRAQLQRIQRRHLEVTAQESAEQHHVVHTGLRLRQCIHLIQQQLLPGLRVRTGAGIHVLLQPIRMYGRSMPAGKRIRRGIIGPSIRARIHAWCVVHCGKSQAACDAGLPEANAGSLRRRAITPLAANLPARAAPPRPRAGAPRRDRR